MTFKCWKVWSPVINHATMRMVLVFLFFLLSEGFRDLILKAESGERAVKAFSLLLQRLIEVILDEHDAAMVSRKRG